MISVIMPVYNAAEFLAASIQSILNQTEPDLELIIVNDGSTDISEEVALSFNDPRIHYLKQANQGIGAARNAGLTVAKGDFIAFQDADDISLPPRLEVLKRQFVSPTIGIAHSDLLIINEKDEPIGYWQCRNTEKARMLRYFVKVGGPFYSISMMVRREALKGFRYDTSLAIGEDTDMLFEIAPKWESVHVSEPLVLYRRHSRNVTGGGDYEKWHRHMHKFLAAHPLQELVPELNWQKDNQSVNEANASAIVSLFLFRRGMIPDGKEWFKKAADLAGDPQSSNFVLAIGSLLTGNYQRATELLVSFPERDAVIENYLGESLALQGQPEQAFTHFIKALELAPHYEEPLENLKGIGSCKYHITTDHRSWSKFRRIR